MKAPRPDRSLRTFAVVLLTFGCVTSTLAAVNVGDRPNIRFKATNGQIVTSEALEGRIVVVDFWATWCPPCVAAMPHMKQIHRELGPQGVQLLGISADRRLGDLQRFVKREGIAWPQLFDNVGMADDWGVRGYPTVYILSPDGEVLWIGHPARMDEPLERAMRDHPPTPPGPALSEEQIEAAILSLTDARNAAQMPDCEQVMSLLQQVPEEAFDERRVIAYAKLLAVQLRDRPAEDPELAAARESNPEGAERLDHLMDVLTPEGEGASSRPATRDGPHPRLVQAKLRRAERADENEDHVAAWKNYRWLLDHAPETDAGTLAAERVVAYEGDPERFAQIMAELQEERARDLMSLAKQYEAVDRPDLAQEKYEEIVELYPNTECCGEAEEKLAAMREG